MKMAKTIKLERFTKETQVKVQLLLEPGFVQVDTGVGFLNHLVTSLAFHAGWSLRLFCKGDLDVDDHHSAEDCAIALGLAFRSAYELEESKARFGYAFAPLDEALARAVVDLSGRPYFEGDLDLTGQMLGTLATENVAHFLRSFAQNAALTLHVDVLRGKNDHHKAEAAFKALALAIQNALLPIPRIQREAANEVLSAKGGCTSGWGNESTKGKVQTSIQVLDSNQMSDSEIERDEEPL